MNLESEFLKLEKEDFGGFVGWVFFCFVFFKAILPALSILEKKHF